MEFEKNGISIVLNREKFEPDEIYLHRGWFIINQKNIFKYFNEIEKISKLWVNYKFKNCKYSENIMSIIKEYEKNYNIIID